MADVLLTHSYFLHFDPKENRAKMPYPPLGTLYAASYLRSLGFEVALHDVMLSKSELEISEALSKHAPPVVVIYDDCFNYLTKMCLTRMREAALVMTRIAKDRGCKVIIFSSDAADHIDKYLSNGADYVVCGEGEVTLGEILKHLSGPHSNQPPLHIRGLAFTDANNVVRTGTRNVVEDLDFFPFPAWDLVDFSRYRSVWKQRHDYYSLNVVSTRGCPFHCNWCAKPIYGQVYHSRSPENVVQEMIYLKETVGPDHIWFADDIFGLRPGWISKFDEVVNRENALIPFKCLSRVDLLLQEDNIRHLQHAGCRSVWVGAESGSQKTLDAMEKGTTVGQIREAAQKLRAMGINVGFFLQFGYPGETKTDIEKTIALVRECMPDEIGISVSYPLPGTRFYDRIKSQLSEKQNWIVSKDLDLMFPGEYVPDFYRMLHRVVHMKFSIWRGQRALRGLFFKPSLLHQSALRHIAGMMYHSLTLPFAQRSLLALERVSQR
jgi:anaerobic magnesium-protoporphyrin IX monomethyl ester cyclase